jgi:hypothetical protein
MPKSSKWFSYPQTFQLNFVSISHLLIRAI